MRSSRENHFTVDRPVAVLMVFTAAVVFGFFSLGRLPVMLMPELSYPTLTVRTEYPGSAPAEVENEISRPIEEALGVVSGLNRISSISRAGVSDVVMEFNWGTDMGEATQDTLEKLDLVFLPQEAEQPLILHFDPSLDPIMELSFSGEGERYKGEEGLRRLRRIADLQIKKALEPIKGVAAVRIRGGLEEEIHVLLDHKAILRRGLDIQTVIDRVRQENINVAGGTIKEGRSEYMVRTLNEYVDIGEIAETVVLRTENTDIRIKDLGFVAQSHKEREIITRTDGSESVQVDIYKEAEANIVDVANRIKTQVGRVQADDEKDSRPAWMKNMPFQQKLPLAQQLYNDESARLQVVADRSIFIESSIREVRNTAILGGLLAIAVLYLFLRDFKATSIIAISIPMSLLITFAPLNLLDVSLNIMSLGGLALGIGMLVDSSIVVLESIFRCREEGDSIKASAIRGTLEVHGAVFASTLTSVAVFFPMVFVEGIAGQAFGDLGMAVTISLLASLLVAVYFIPMLASRQKPEFTFDPDHVNQTKEWACLNQFKSSRASMKPLWFWLALPYLVFRFLLAGFFEVIGRLLLMLIRGTSYLTCRILVPAVSKSGQGLLSKPFGVTRKLMGNLENQYPIWISKALDHPGKILVFILLCGIGLWQAGLRLQSELLPEVHQGEFTFEINLPVGTPIEETATILAPVEKAILENKEDIQSLLLTYGFDVTNMKRSDEGEHSARFKVLLVPGKNPEEIEDRVVSRIRSYLEQVPDVDFRVVRPVLFSSKTPIVVEVRGDSISRLKDYAEQASSLLRTLPELADVETTLKSGAPEVQISFDRDQIMRFGLNLGTVADKVRNMVKGFEASKFNLKDRRIPILVRLQEDDRTFLMDIENLVIEGQSTSEIIPLHAVSDLTVGEGPSEIRRIDGERVALIQANIATGSLGGAVEQIKRTLTNSMTWPGDMNFFITGQNEEWERSRNSLYLALGLSVFLVYVIMASQFESLIQPFIIMFTIPLAFLGSAIGLLFTGTSLSIVVFLGMIMLVGIVVNNAIVLVDYVNQLRLRGQNRREAIINAGRIRLRPILITTMTTVLGLLPMAMGLGDGSEIRRPMALTVICGLISSTVLTLILIPTLYDVMDRLKERFIRTDMMPVFQDPEQPLP